MGWIAGLYRFTGRARRRTYWAVSIAGSLVMLTGVGLLMQPEFEDSLVLVALACLAVFAALPAMLAVSVRRLHDRNRSGWWAAFYWGAPAIFGPGVDGSGSLILGLHETLQAALTLLSSGVSVWALVDLGILGGRDPNRFGDNPKSPAVAEIFN